MNTVSIEIPSAENSVRKVEQVRHRKFWKPLLSAAVAAVAALGMGLGANTALAAPTEISGYAHVDYVSLNYSGGQFELGSNLNDTEWVPAGTYSIAVPLTTGASGTGYIIPQERTEAISRNVPWVGFSGDNSTWNRGANSVDITLSDIDFTPVNSNEDEGTVTVSQNGQTWFDSEEDIHTFDFDGEPDEESFHEHPEWVFSEPGTYVLTFSAETDNGGVAAEQEYTFNVGL